MVGFRKDPKLSTRYVEIPLDYSVYSYEPIRTQNTAEDDIARLLVGRVSDAALGTIEAIANFNFSPPIETQFPTPAAAFLSLTLQLQFDYYAYGVMDSSDLQLQVHEILDQMTTDRPYYASTPIPTQSVAIGDTIIAPGPIALADGWEKYTNLDASDNKTFTLPIKLSGTMGQMLLSDLQNNRGIFNNFGEFSSRYPGLSVSMPAGNKILGFTPIYGLPTPGEFDSKLALQYLEGTDTVAVDFPIYYAAVTNSTGGTTLMPVVSFTSLSFDPTGGPLDGLLPFQDIHPADDKMYVQSGTGLIGKYDLTKFYTYFDTLKDVVLNSAEMVLTNTSTFRPPQKLEMVLLDDVNNFRPIYFDTVIASVPKRIKDPYLEKLEFNGAIALTALSATDTRAVVLNAITNNTIPVNQQTGVVSLTILTEFYQQILKEKSHPRKATAFSILPVNTEFSKTVSALNLNASSAVLKIYYSKPLTSLP